MTTLTFIFRKPRLPIIIDTGAGLIGAKSWPACQKLLAKLPFGDTAEPNVIDCTGEVFFWFPQHSSFSISAKRRWTKLAVIHLYNDNARQSGWPEYSTTSLSNKNLAKVVQDIVDLLTCHANPVMLSTAK